MSPSRTQSMADSLLRAALTVLFMLLFHACDDDSASMMSSVHHGGDIERGTAGELTGGDELSGEQHTVEFSEEAWVRIGTGFRRFESLSEGQEVPIIAGIQGGFHVWGGFIGAGFNDADVRVLYSLELDGEVIASADYTEFELPKNSRDEFEYAGVSVIYFRNEDVEPSSGKEMTLKLEVITLDGLSLNDEAQLTPVCCE